MSASLVGSEMCIRDRPHPRARLGRPAVHRPHHITSCQQGKQGWSPDFGRGPARVQTRSEGARPRVQSD
eukprot:4635647-Alexandrium_andersonii.AAC.1